MGLSVPHGTGELRSHDYSHKHREPTGSARISGRPKRADGTSRAVQNPLCSTAGSFAGDRTESRGTARSGNHRRCSWRAGELHDAQQQHARTGLVIQIAKERARADGARAAPISCQCCVQRRSTAKQRVRQPERHAAGRPQQQAELRSFSRRSPVSGH